MKILITNHGNRLNKGVAALLHSQVSIFKKRFPDAEFFVFTYYPKIENNFNKPYLEYYKIIGKFSKKDIRTNFFTLQNIILALLWRFFNIWGINLRLTGPLEIYKKADLIFGSGGDGLTEDYGTPLNMVLNLWFGIILKRPVIIFGESIGYFRNPFNKLIIKFLLKRVELITLRDEISKKNVESLNLKVPILLTADPAFFLESASEERVDEIMKIEGVGNPFVGFSVSKLFSRYNFKQFDSAKNNHYLKIMANTADYLAGKGFDIIFIPHVIDQPNNDDRDVADIIINLMKNKNKVVSIKNEYTAEELKGIIGRGRLFIGARMHSCIAATSMAVPTIAVAYSHKTHGIIGDMLGMERFVFNFDELEFLELKSSLDVLLNKNQELREKLEKSVKLVKQRILDGLEFINFFIFKKNESKKI